MAKQPPSATSSPDRLRAFTLVGVRARLNQLYLEMVAILHEFPDAAPPASDAGRLFAATVRNVSALIAPAKPQVEESSRTAKPLKKPLSPAKRTALAKAQEARWHAHRPMRRRDRSAEIQTRLRSMLAAREVSTKELGATVGREFGVSRDRIRQILIEIGARRRKDGNKAFWTLQKKNKGTPKGSWTPERKARFVATMQRKGIFKQPDAAHEATSPEPSPLDALAWQNDGEHYMEPAPVNYQPEPPTNVI